jgi:hypothetical protein
MKRIFLIFTLILSLVVNSQTQNLNGVKTFTSPPKFKNVLQNNANTKVLTINPITDSVEWLDKATFGGSSTIPTIDEVLGAGNTASNKMITFTEFQTFPPFGSTYALLSAGTGLRLQTNASSSFTKYASLRSDLLTEQRFFQFPNESGTLLVDAPANGASYVRKNNAWEAASSTPAVSSTASGIVNNIALQELGGVDKTINGVRIGQGNAANLDNVCLGVETLQANQSSNNVAVGAQAMKNNLNGNNNVAVGAKALFSNTNGYYNTAVGTNALYSNTIGVNNTALGKNALLVNTANSNTAIGSEALTSNTLGIFNVATGYNALHNNTTGLANIAIGTGVMYYNTTGSSNVCVGNSVGVSLTTGNNNLILGDALDVTSPSMSNTVLIGTNGVVKISVDASNKTSLIGLLNIGNTPIYANNTSALAGGLTTNDVYKTGTGQLMIVY